MISVPSICRWAGPIIDVLLDYVGHVTLCSRLMEHLDSYSEWSNIKEKAGDWISDSQLITNDHMFVLVVLVLVLVPSAFLAAPPRPLLHLCRLQILQLVGSRSLKRLPLPGGLLRFLQHKEMLLDDYWHVSTLTHWPTPWYRSVTWWRRQRSRMWTQWNVWAWSWWFDLDQQDLHEL